MSFKWLSIVGDAVVHIWLRLLFVDYLASYFVLDSDHLLREYVFVTQVWIVYIWSCSLANYDSSVVLWLHVHLLDVLFLVWITSDWWNVGNSTLIYKRSLVVRWRLLRTRSLQHLWIFCGFWRVSRLLEFTLFLDASCFGEVPSINEILISGLLSVYARFLGIWLMLWRFRLLNSVLLAHDLLLLVYACNWWRNYNWILALVIWVRLISIAIIINRGLLRLDARLVRNLWYDFSSRTIDLLILVVTWTIGITVFSASPIIEVWLHYLHFWRW